MSFSILCSPFTAIVPLGLLSLASMLDYAIQPRSPADGVEMLRQSSAPISRLPFALPFVISGNFTCYHSTNSCSRPVFIGILALVQERAALSGLISPGD